MGDTSAILVNSVRIVMRCVMRVHFNENTWFEGMNYGENVGNIKINDSPIGYALT